MYGFLRTPNASPSTSSQNSKITAPSTMIVRASRFLLSSAALVGNGHRSANSFVLKASFNRVNGVNGSSGLFSTKLDPDQPVRWGILSAGKISSDFAKAIAITDGAMAKAVAARSGDMAKEFAAKHQVEKSYGSYDDLLADPEVDVVYVGSVADQHFKLATKSLLAGKPTVVEKPLTLTHKQSETLVHLAKQTDTFLMEGLWTRCFPAMRKARALIAAGAIGRPVCVQGDFGWSTAACGQDDRIWYPDSGGFTYDIGMYLAQLGQLAYPGYDVEQIQAMGTVKNGIDLTVLANLRYGSPETHNKGLLQFYVTGDANTEERVCIQGTTGRIVMDPPAHVPSVLRLFTDEGRGVSKETVLDFSLPDDSYTSWNYPRSIGFTYQVETVGEALRAGKRECDDMTHEDSLQLAAIVDEIRGQVVIGGALNVTAGYNTACDDTASDQAVVA